MEKVEGYVWCEVHGDVHDESIRPYDGPPYGKHEDGTPYWLIYDDEGEVIEAPPECQSADWRRLWKGAVVR